MENLFGKYPSAIYKNLWSSGAGRLDPSLRGGSGGGRLSIPLFEDLWFEIEFDVGLFKILRSTSELPKRSSMGPGQKGAEGPRLGMQ